MQGEGQEIGIWEKVDFEAVNEADDSSFTSQKEVAEERIRSWKRWRVVLDVLGVIFWAYLVLKVFVFDVDREAVAALAPNDSWIVDFRLLFFLAVIAGAVVLLGVKKSLSGFLYILLFPLIVLLWKIPKLIYKSKSWVALFAVIHVVATVIANFRYVVVAAAAALIASTVIMFTNSVPLLVAAMIVLGSLLIYALFRTLRFSAKPASFIRIQERALDRIRKREDLPQIAAVGEDLRGSEVQRFSQEQQTLFVTRLQSAVLIQRLPLFWAYQLDEYRRSPVPVLFTGLAYAWLVLQTVVGLTLLNYALYGVDASAFNYADPPSFVVFARYAVSSLTGNEISAVQPASGMANALFLGATAFGVIFLIGFVVGLFLSFRQKSQDAALREMITGFKNQSRALERQLRSEYEVGSVEEALKRLEELRAGLLGVISFFSSRIPSDFIDRIDDDPDAGESSTA